MDWGGICIVCSRFLSFSRVICPVRVVIIIECVMFHYCSISGKIKNIHKRIVVLCVFSGLGVCVCILMLFYVALLVVLRW
jgi:hypothetical protein